MEKFLLFLEIILLISFLIFVLGNKLSTKRLPRNGRGIFVFGNIVVKNYNHTMKDDDLHFFFSGLPDDLKELDVDIHILNSCFRIFFSKFIFNFHIRKVALSPYSPGIFLVENDIILHMPYKQKLLQKEKIDFPLLRKTLHIVTLYKILPKDGCSLTEKQHFTLLSFFTILHELRHAYQKKHFSEWLDEAKSKMLSGEYEVEYDSQVIEIDANTFTQDYLLSKEQIFSRHLGIDGFNIISNPNSKTKAL